MNFWDNCFERDDLTVTNDEDRDIGNQAHDRLITTANSCIVAFCLFPLLKLSIFNTYIIHKDFQFGVGGGGQRPESKDSRAKLYLL